MFSQNVDTCGFFFPVRLCCLAYTIQLRDSAKQNHTLVHRHTLRCDQTWLAGKWTMHRWFPYQNIHSVRGFSSQPCLMTPESKTNVIPPAAVLNGYAPIIPQLCWAPWHTAASTCLEQSIIHACISSKKSLELYPNVTVENQNPYGPLVNLCI